MYANFLFLGTISAKIFGSKNNWLLSENQDNDDDNMSVISDDNMSIISDDNIMNKDIVFHNLVLNYFPSYIFGQLTIVN